MGNFPRDLFNINRALEKYVIEKRQNSDKPSLSNLLSIQGGSILKFSFQIIITLVGLLPELAMAHARLRVAEADGSIPRLISRNNLDSNKGGAPDAVPCGTASTTRSDNPVVLIAGETLDVNFEETISHSGTFQLNFSEAGLVNFVNLTTLTDDATALAGSSNQYQFTGVQVPNTPCTDCTLQFIQDMGGLSPYKSCVDIIITTADAPPPQQPTGFSVTK